MGVQRVNQYNNQHWISLFVISVFVYEMRTRPFVAIAG